MSGRHDSCPECGRRKPVQWAVCLLCPMDKFDPRPKIQIRRRKGRGKSEMMSAFWRVGVDNG